MFLLALGNKLQSRYQHVSRPKTTSLGMLTSRMHINGGRRRSFVSAADNDRLVTDTSVKGYGGAESSISDNQLSTVNSSSEDSPGGNSVGEESGPQTSGASNGSTVSADMKSRPKRSPLTARERLKAARVLSRYTESKASKSEMGSKVLDAMRESDKGKKRSGLPEAPENMFDDSKRGMPKDGEKRSKKRMQHRWNNAGLPTQHNPEISKLEREGLDDSRIITKQEQSGAHDTPKQ
ncbi:hypothetical protein NC653_025896 [Populus alba x Populus x berolinensis]|uniref:Uncharacterized protein n=1 Tax=Populus alba x Populus x berolinensis TaxID=444605 RepID=A0AAD6MD77_9ROSI|nr:hypothetical protein NC653_025896 [Populus alba x Populus x berolinensis]